jgi:hypothetical protein
MYFLYVILSVSFGCDCTADKSKIYFCMYVPTGMSDIKKGGTVVGNDLLRKIYVTISFINYVILK